jgi:hypothetical protein
MTPGSINLTQGDDGVSRPARGWRLVVILSGAALLWCVVVGLLLWFLPAGGGQSFSSISALGPVPLIIPVVLATAALCSTLIHRRAPIIGATAALGGYALLTGLSIGLAYLPAVGALIACVVASNASTTRPARVPRSDPVTRP